MAAQPAAAEPYIREFDARVTDVVDGGIILDDTYFYAESGGQPADRGTIESVAVTDVERRNGRTVHHVADPTAFDSGMAVTGSIDWDFRRYCMVAHTASHALYGAARVRFDDLGYGGFEITPDKVRIDFETPDPIDDDEVFALERLTNEVIWEDRPVTWSEWPAEAVATHDDIALNVATEVVDTAETVRVVEIDGWDLAACGGTHVQSTGEIGAIAVLDRSNPGEGMTRIEFTVGPGRIDRHIAEKRAAWEAKRTLETDVAGVSDRIETLTDELTQHETEIERLTRQLIAATLTGDDARQRTIGDDRWTFAVVDTGDAGTIADILQDLKGDIADGVAVARDDQRVQLVVVSPGDPAADAIIAATLDELESGGGGGSPTSAQAGGIATDAAEALEYLEAAVEDLTQ